MRELVSSDIITEKLLRDGTLKQPETEVEDALESRCTLILDRLYQILLHALQSYTTQPKQTTTKNRIISDNIVYFIL